MQEILGAGGAEGAFITAYASIGRVRRQVTIAAFTIRAEFQHNSLLGGRSIGCEYTKSGQQDPRFSSGICGSVLPFTCCFCPKTVHSAASTQVAGNAVSRELTDNFGLIAHWKHQNL